MGAEIRWENYNKMCTPNKFKIDKCALIVWLYLFLSLLFFWQFAYDDIENATNMVVSDKPLRLYADHPTYVNDYNDTENFRIAFLLLRPNHLGPFVIQWLIGNNLLIIYIYNIFVLIVSIHYLFKIPHIDNKLILLLILINPITFISLFSLNKENISFLSVILFVYYIHQPKKQYLILSFFIGFIAKKELLIYLFISFIISKYLKKWITRPYFTAFFMLLVLSASSLLINKLFASINSYADESQLLTDNGKGGGTILVLNNIQNSYGYIFAFLPKLFLNLYGSVLSRTEQLFAYEDVYNDVVVWGQSFLFLIILPWAFFHSRRRNYETQQNIWFCFIFSCIIFSYIPVVQNRYFYPSYLLLAVIVSHKNIYPHSALD
jgi:hypothetical protein